MQGPFDNDKGEIFAGTSNWFGIFVCGTRGTNESTADVRGPSPVKPGQPKLNMASANNRQKVGGTTPSLAPDCAQEKARDMGAVPRGRRFCGEGPVSHYVGPGFRRTRTGLAKSKKQTEPNSAKKGGVVSPPLFFFGFVLAFGEFPPPPRFFGSVLNGSHQKSISGELSGHPANCSWVSTV